MTEAEAKTKWCPMYRSSTNDNRPWVWNPGGQPSGEISMLAAGCIGSACMAWRWEDEDTFEQRFTEWEDAANIGGIQRGPEPVQGGFCGLVGKP